MDSDLDNIRDYITQLKICLDKLREDINTKLNEYNDSIQFVETLLRQSPEITTTLGNKLTNASKDTSIQLRQSHT